MNIRLGSKHIFEMFLILIITSVNIIQMRINIITEGTTPWTNVPVSQFENYFYINISFLNHLNNQYYYNIFFLKKIISNIITSQILRVFLQ